MTYVMSILHSSAPKSQTDCEGRPESVGDCCGNFKHKPCFMTQSGAGTPLLDASISYSQVLGPP